jgi:rhamnulokinase
LAEARQGKYLPSEKQETFVPHYLAIDLGASSGRAILGRLDTPTAEDLAGTTVPGERPASHAVPVLELEEVHRFETPVLEDDGHFYWNLGRLTTDIAASLHKALRVRPDLRSVSVDSWAVDYVPLDEAGQPVRDPFCYRDARTRGMIDRAFETVSRERLYTLTGIQYLEFNTLFQLLADREHQPQLFARTRNRLLMADYFNHVLGGRAVIDLSMASTTHMLDARTQEWCREILDAFGIRSSRLPEIVSPGTVIGSAASSPSTAVIASCSHDTGAAVAAVPADEGTEDWCYLSLGTWGLIGIESDVPILTRKALEAGYTNEVGLGGRVRFLKNLVGMWPLQECMREWNAEATVTYDTILDEAAASPDPVKTIDLSDPVFTTPGGMEQRLLDYCDLHGIARPGDRGTLVRLILASIAQSMAGAIEDLEAVVERGIHTIHIVGGGSQNHLLCQMAADTTRRRVTAGPVEATAIGNLLIQSETMGDLPRGVSIRDVVRNSFSVREFLPDG